MSPPLALSWYDDLALLDAVSKELNAIIHDEEAAGTGKGDHFAAAGANSRIWNAHEKLCMRAPELYARYNANELTRRVSESWLGSGYQITFQVNVVRPGGKAQTAHRDYHMGFQDAATLRGMSVESGPTKLLPYSQSYLPGYLAVLRPEFRETFEANYVQVPLSKGDLLFFNPATFHAAGDNNTADVNRMANLMQVGSVYGRSIEIVDRLSPREADTVIAATAEGYPFPANLDIDSPLSGMAPPSQQDVLRQALAEGWTQAQLEQAIAEQNSRKRSH